MKLADELKKESQKSFDVWIDQLVEELKPQLKESAQKGFTGNRLNVSTRDDSHFFNNQCVLEKLEKSLGGCTVILDHNKRKSMFTNQEYTVTYLVIRWG